MDQAHLRNLALSAAVPAFLAICALAQTGSAKAPTGKSAEEAFKNIQVLKTTPADELIPAMQFMTYSLGVECSYCHVEGAMEKDDKKPKQTARKMMQMVAAINQNNFDAKQMVTCNSCHHGSPHPSAVPVIADGSMRPMMGNEAHEDNRTSTLPSADQILEKYVEAVGGAAALAKVNSREMRGSMSLGGRALPVEIISKAGDKQLTIVHLPNGDNITTYDGTSGWTLGPNRPLHEIPRVEVASARVESDIRLPLDMKHIFSELKVGPPEKIGDHEAYVVSGMNSGEIGAKFYFDEDSGLLVRILRYTRSPLGLNPTQIDYADYRAQDGMKVPWQQTIARPNSRFTIQMQEVKFNVPVDDARFARPSAEAHSRPAQ
jgi:photosynthetic reaction center cytochrome c subunit